MRALGAVAALGLGYVLAAKVGWAGLGSSVWFAAACGATAVAGAARGVICRIALFAAVSAFAGGWFTLRMFEPPLTDVRRLLAGQERDVLVTVRGRVLDTPRPAPRDRGPFDAPIPTESESYFPLRVLAIGHGAEETAAGGRLWVRVSVRSPALRAGDVVRVTGLARSVPPPRNPGERDRRLWAWQEGFGGTLIVPSPHLVQADTRPAGPAGDLAGVLVSLRATLRDRARGILMGGGEPGPARALLGALILGEQEPALRDVRSAFTRLGLAHLLAISGFHLTVMAAVVLVALRLGGDLGRLEAVLTAALIVLYLAILPVQAPVWRAALMVLGLLGAQAAGRRHDPLAVLAWIAVVMLLWRPADLWSLGFQLSFGLVAVLIWTGEHTHARLWGRDLPGTVPALPMFRTAAVRHIRRLISANVVCAVASAPLVAFHTGLVSPWAVAAGVIVVVPVVVLMIVAYATLVVGVLIPPAGTWAAAGVERLGGVTAWLVRTLDALPGTSLTVPSISLAWTAAATGTALLWLVRWHWRDGRAWGVTGALGLWLAVECWLGPTLPRGVALRVDALAVDDGTCVLVRSGRDALLWDCGSLTPGLGRVTIPRAVRALGVWRVPVAVISHANADHFSALPDVLDPLGVRVVCVGRSFMTLTGARPDTPAGRLLAELYARGVEVRVLEAGDRLEFGAAHLRIVSPPEASAFTRENDRSLVAVITPAQMRTLQPVSLLLTGDIEAQGIAHVREALPPGRYAVVEAPHHGSGRAQAVQFVTELAPAAVIQSTGRGRTNDPRWEPLRAQARWLCTATDGAVWVQIMEDGTVRTGSFRGR